MWKTIYGQNNRLQSSIASLRDSSEIAKRHRMSLEMEQTLNPCSSAPRCEMAQTTPKLQIVFVQCHWIQDTIEQYLADPGLEN